MPGWSHLWFHDDDQVEPTYAESKLLGCCTDIAVIDTPPHDSEESNIHFNPDGTIAYCTIACSMIRRDVFEKLPEPWFDSRYDFQPSGVKDGKIIFHRLDKSNDNNVGEDVYFIRNAIELGFTIGVVKGAKCKHYKVGNTKTAET